MAVYWGPELTYVYNDAERAILGDLHPVALGLPAAQVLRDSWDVTGPELRTVMARGASSRTDEESPCANRIEVLHTADFSYSYTPLLDELGEIAGVLVVRTLWDDLRAAQRRVAAAGDAERRRIERNLHDGAQQRLISLRIELGLLDDLIEREPVEAAHRLGELRRELDDALDELRELAHGLYPPVLASDGLLAALAAMARRAPVPVRLDSAGVQRVAAPIESAAYFCCAEAVQNATKHGGDAVRVTIRLRMSDGLLRFSITDDGCGFDVRATEPQLGLANLRDRLEALGGDLEVSSDLGRGTTVAGAIPLR